MCKIKHYYCILGFEDAILMQTIRKYLVYGYVPIVERAFRSDTRESCVAQRSIYVIMSGNEGTRRYINQVRSAMSSFFRIADIYIYIYVCVCVYI